MAETNVHGPGSVPARAEDNCESMAAFDALPASLRRAFATANTNYATISVHDAVRRGCPPSVIVRGIADADRKMAAAYYASLGARHAD